MEEIKIENGERYVLVQGAGVLGYHRFEELIPCCPRKARNDSGSGWWLAAPAFLAEAYVTAEGNLTIQADVEEIHGLRPTLELSGVRGYVPGDEFAFASTRFMLLDEGCALCLDVVAQTACGRKRAGFERSELKKATDAWFSAALRQWNEKTAG